MDIDPVKIEVDELNPDVHPLLDHPDIWAGILAVLEEDKSYGAMANLAVQFKQLKALVRPALKRIRKRVVLDLDDLSRTPESKWEDIEIVTCNELSALPYGAFWPDDQVAARIETIKQKLKPHIIAFRGHSHPCTVKLWQFFPDARILRIQEDSTTQPIRDIGPLSLQARQDMFPPGYFIGAVNEVAGDLVFRAAHHVPENVEFRYVSHESYQATLADFRQGQQWLLMRATTVNGLVLKRQLLDVFIDEDFQEETLTNLEEGTILPADVKFETITIDYYIQLFTVQPGPLFATGPEDYPAGYKRLSTIIDRLADQHLDKNSRITFRFFVIRHNRWQPRAEMTPVYQTVVELEAGFHRKRVLNVLERTLDRDFVMCAVNGGCARCRQ